MQDRDHPKGYPMLAQVAIQQGRNLYKNLRKLLREQPADLKKFSFRNKGVMATVGRNKAVVDLPGNITFGGRLAWLAWMFVYLLSIIGFRDKLVIISNWIWNYITYDRATRLIIRFFIPNNGVDREE